MNPSFMAMQKAGLAMMTLMLTGKEHTPKAKGTQETSINGRAFAPGHGVQQEVSSEAKEAKVRTHLDKLALEASARSIQSGWITKCGEKPKYPTSDLIDLLHEHIAETAARTKAEEEFEKAEADANNAKIDETSTHGDTLSALHRTHAAYIKRRIAAAELAADPVKYAYLKRRDVDLEHCDTMDRINREAQRQQGQERREAATNAVVHTGEAMNLKEAGANNGTRFEAQ